MKTLGHDIKALILSLAILAAHLVQGAGADDAAQDLTLATTGLWCDEAAVVQTL